MTPLSTFLATQGRKSRPRTSREQGEGFFAQARSRNVAPTAVVVAIACALSAGGCRPPQVAPQHRRLIESLRTAISSRNADWLQTSASQVEAAHAKGQMSEREFATFDHIIRLAREGDWAAAEKQCIKLAKAQRVTEADRSRLEAERASRRKSQPRETPSGGQTATRSVR